MKPRRRERPAPLSLDPSADRVRMCADAILRELPARRRPLTWPAALRLLRPLGFTDADIAAALSRLVWGSLLQPTPLGWAPTRHTSVDPEADALGALRVAERRYLAGRGWSRVERTSEARPRNTLREKLLAVGERWAHPDWAWPTPIEEAVQVQAALDEVALQASAPGAFEAEEAVEAMAEIQIGTERWRAARGG